jgi:hypothetical protein
MKAYPAKEALRCVRLIESLSTVGIDKELFITPQTVQEKFDALLKEQNDFIERQMKNFLESYGSRRNMQPGIDQIKYALSKLTERPVYYIWLNPAFCHSRESGNQVARAS